ncbi:MAG: hypothetical protein IT324_23305 [Anaerolineae bacterium]|nr:hypothetical protein [Anaerolineae bacterium]
MHPDKHSQRQRGQGLVEYALILALVAVVVVVILFFVGTGVQRTFGVIAAALGVQYNSVGQHSIEITTAQCIAVLPDGPTGLWVLGNTDENVANLTGSTEQAVGMDMDGAPSPVEENPPNGFKFYPTLSHTADLSACPKAVVIQAKDGTIAVSPVTATTVTAP